MSAPLTRPIDWLGVFTWLVIALFVAGFLVLIVFFGMDIAHTSREKKRWDNWCLAQGGAVTTTPYVPESAQGRFTGNVVCVVDGKVVGSRAGVLR